MYINVYAQRDHEMETLNNYVQASYISILLFGLAFIHYKIHYKILHIFK